MWLKLCKYFISGLL